MTWPSILSLSSEHAFSRFSFLTYFQISAIMEQQRLQKCPEHNWSVSNSWFLLSLYFYFTQAFSGEYFSKTQTLPVSNICVSADENILYGRS